MPKMFTSVNANNLEKEAEKDFFDRHTPRIICESTVKAGEKLKVKVKIGDEYLHPDDYDHYISFVQLWNRETFLAEAHFTPGTLGNKPSHLEVDFFIIPKVSMNLSALACCTKHGLWQSEAKFVKVL